MDQQALRIGWDGTLDRIHHMLYVKCREALGREASPTAAVIDSQSVKSAEKGGLRLIRRVTMREKRSRARSATFSSAGLDKLGQFGLLPHRQFRSGTWRFEIAKPGQSRGVVTVHPVPQGLTVHAAGFGRRFAVHAIEYQCKRKYPTRH